MPARNQLVDLVRQLQTIELMLIAGATIYDMAEELAISDRQVRRLVDHLRALSVEIRSNYKTGDRKAALLRAKKSTRLFNSRTDISSRARQVRKS